MAVDLGRRVGGVRGIGWIVVLLLILAFLYIVIFGSKAVATWPPSWWGLFVLVLAYAVSAGATGSVNPFALGVGDDGRLSLSKTQTLFWTFVVLYAFAALYAKDVKECAKPGVSCASPSAVSTPVPSPTALPSGQPQTAPQIGANAMIPIAFPGSVLLLLGFSVTSLVAAAGITRSQIASGAKKSQLTNDDLSPKWLIQNDDGRVDLTRFQVVLWTLVAGGAFINETQVLLGQSGPQLSLPDVGSALVLLMGLGQAAYVGGKLVVTPKPAVFRIIPPHAPVSTPAATMPVTISGSGFGTQSPTSFVLVDEAALPSSNVSAWSDSTIIFTVPSIEPSTGQPWPQPRGVKISVAVGSMQSDPVPFTVP